MNYEQALEYIHGINAHGSKLGLSRTRELLNRMGTVSYTHLDVYKRQQQALDL